jgi:hypothetical protein
MLGSGQTEMARQVKSKVKSMLIIFFDIKGIDHKEFVLAGQTVNSTYCCDILRRLRENVRRLRSELWRQLQLLHHDNAPSRIFSFKRGFLSFPTQPYFSLFPRLKIKLKGRHFDAAEMMEAESGGAEQPHRTRLPGCI